MADLNYVEMSDEDLLNLEAPASTDTPAPGAEEDTPTSTNGIFEAEDDDSPALLEDALDAPDSTKDIEEVSEAPVAEGDEPKGEETVTAEGGEGNDETHTQENTTPSSEESSSDSDHTTPHHPEVNAASAEDESSDPENSLNFEAEYKKIMAPFKANGREFKLQSPDEAIRLMQMGANYTKKMQALKPNLKLMRMLENNNLLDESKLSFLIDLDRKEPSAIQKLLHDGKIDPLDIDTASNPAYEPGNHTVSDDEMDFHDALGDVTSTPTGRETVKLIENLWDPASKQAIFKEPNVLRIINEQRANGIYDIIASEIDRQTTLGIIGSNVPFIQAYKQVGDTLHAEGRLTPNTGSDEIPVNESKMPERQVIETRTATRKPAVSNGDKAKAASSVSTAPKSPPKPFDPFNMSDEEIMRISSPHV